VPTPVLECVPNVSEGRDRRVIDGLADAVRAVPGVHLADVHADPDHHRSVFTLLGTPADVQAGALALAAAVFDSVDMRQHHGVHPRLGALDVVPFVPLRGLDASEAIAAAHAVGRALGERHGVPVFFYGQAASRPDRRMLAHVRAGEYEGLAARLADPAQRPDAGPTRFDPARGATAVGARGILVAFNVWLDSQDLAAAREIARAVRESSGGLPAVQALGLPVARDRCVQVSMNLLDTGRTSVARAFDTVSAAAARRGIPVARSELVGLAPRSAFDGRAPESLGLAGMQSAQYLDTHLDALP
jgi:glutamate formiminotransferase